MTPALAKRERPTTSQAAWSRRQLASVALAIALATTGVLPVFLTGALAVQLEAHLQVGTTAIGGAVATYFCASALSSVRGGRLAERVGPLKVLLVAVGLAGVALLGIGVAVTSLPALLGFLVVGGLSNGAMQPAVNLLLTQVVDDGRRGLAFGVKQAAIPTSTLLSGLAVPALALTAGWHVAYLAAGGLTVLVATALVTVGPRLMPAPPPAPGRVRTTAGGDGRPGRLELRRPAGRGQRPDRKRDRGQPGRGSTFDIRPLVFLAVAMACAVAASNAMGSFVVPGAVHDGIAPGLAGFLSAAGSVVGLSARVGLGWRADRRDVRGHRAADDHLATVTVLVAVGALGYGALAVGNLGLLVPAVLVAYGGGWGYNGLFNLAVVRAYPDAPARATGVTQVGTYVGGMVGPFGFGVVVDHFGFAVGWALCAVLAVLAVGAFAVSRRRLRTAAALAGSPAAVPLAEDEPAPGRPSTAPAG